MSVLLAVFGEKGYHQYRLSGCQNADFCVWLSDRTFKLKKSLRILMENIDGQWYIKPSDSYILKENPASKRRLIPGDSFDIISAFGEIYTFTVYNLLHPCCPYHKFYTKEEINIGRDELNDISVAGQKAVSRIHARIIRTDQGWMIESSGINGLYVNGIFLKGRGTLKFGDSINIVGLQIIFLDRYIAVETAIFCVSTKLEEVSEKTSLKAAGRLEETEREESADQAFVHRSPRIFKNTDDSPVEIDPPPEKEISDDMPVIMSILSNLFMSVPMVAGSFFMIYASRKEGGGQQLYMYGGLIMAAMSLISALTWVLIQAFYSRRKDEKRWRQYKESYRAYLGDKEREIQKRSSELRDLLLERYTDCSDCLKRLQAGNFLWGRMPYHKDFMDCRLGTGDMAQPIPISEPELHFSTRENELADLMKSVCSKYKVIRDVPIWISLHDNRHVGLIAREEKERQALARSMIVQFAFHNCYTETRIGLIYDRELSSDQNNWQFMRWLPHVWNEDHGLRLLASNREEAGKVFYYLLGLIKKRQEEKSESLPAIILFIAAPHFLEGEPVEKYLLQRKNQYGIFTVWLTAERELLPSSCECIIEKTEEFQGVCHLTRDLRRQVCFDQIGEEEADSFARRLSGLRVSERSESGQIPQNVSFFEMLGLEAIEELNVLSSWKKNKVIDSLRAPVGLAAGRKTLYLDIHEKYHGPHGLVAGTTGSGKSELLQTYILSLVLMYGPESVNLFLIDYKGGGMSGLFVGLPHISGQISNLSGSQVRRAMAALRSENQRRQRLFTKYGVNNISAYMKLYYSMKEMNLDPAGEDPDKNDMEAVPHLLIIIDEFAEMKREEPEFIEELISIAQVGRSSGLHLILATQKPGGTVDDKIWSNARFRMCLRVQEKQDSMDMLHKTDAADLTQTGRCCFQVGNDEIYEIFQTGWSGAEYKTGRKRKSSALILFSGEEDSIPLTGRASVTGSRTQFDVLKELIIKTAEEGGYAQVRQLFMEPLPRQIFMSKIVWPDDTKENFEVCIGLADDPLSQRQFPAVFSLECHRVVCGLPMTGKSTLLQTFLYEAVTRFDAGQIQIYILDFSNNTLKAFEEMPQVGGVISRGEEKKCHTFFYMIEQILTDRRRILEGTNYRQYLASCGHGIKDIVMPRLQLVIDNFSSFNEKTGQVFEDILLRLCKEGENLGITLLVSCGGFSAGELPPLMAQYFKEALCLELPERFSYSEILGGVELPVTPEKNIKGRGIARFSDQILEFQTGLAVDAADDYERMNLIREEAAGRKSRYKGPLPAAVRSIPDKAVLSAFYESEEVRAILKKPNLLPFAYVIKTAEIAFLPSDRPGCFLISGKRRSGKHELMRILIESLKRKGAGSLCIIDSSKRWGMYSDDPGVEYYFDNNKTALHYLEDIRNQSRQGVSYDEVNMSRERDNKASLAYIFIEDLYALYADAGEDTFCLDVVEEAVWEKRLGLDLCLIALIHEEDYFLINDLSICRTMCMYKSGIHLGGNMAEDPVFEHIGLSFEEQTETLKAGTGYLFAPESEPARILIPEIDL